MANLQQLCIKEQCGDVKDYDAELARKQDKLVPGENITLNGSVINATDTKYTNATQSAAGLMSAADKKKLDEMEPSVPATETPLMDGTGAVGTHTKYAREDHVHPSDTSKQDKLTAGSGITIRKSGDNTIIESTGGGSGLKWTKDVDGEGEESLQGVVQNDVENNVVEGKFALAEGESTAAYGEASHAAGSGTTAEGMASHAEGSSSEAYGEASHAEGSWSVSGVYDMPDGEAAHAEGYGTLATGKGAHSEGDGSYIDDAGGEDYGHVIASGNGSHAEGACVTLENEAQLYSADLEASGTASHAEGGGTTAEGDYSHAEGLGNEARGMASHAEGGIITEYTTLSGNVKEFCPNIAAGNASHAEGIMTTANGEAQHVSGINNIPDNDNRYVEIVGIGTYKKNESTTYLKKNGRTLDWQGREWLSGGLILSAPNNTKYLITVANDGTLITTPFTEY